MAGDGRVPVVVRPLDRALDVLRIVLIPLVVVALGIPAGSTLTRSLDGTQRTWLIAVGVVATVAAYVLVLHTQMVGDRVDRFIAQLRRSVAVACNHDEGEPHQDGRIACMLTPDVLRAPLFDYVEQRDAVIALADACRRNEAGKFWFLEGDSGRGKTRTALRFVQHLARDRELFQLGSRCFLFDFGDAKIAQEQLLKCLSRTRNDNSVVLVDNFQLVKDDVLRALTRRLIERSDPIPPQLLVFLTRPGEAWNVSLGADVQLLSLAKAHDRHLTLAGPSSETVARAVHEVDPDAARLIRELRVDGAASATQLHLAQVIVRNGHTPPEALAILRLLARDPEGPPPPDELVHVLAIVSGLSMHRGTFSRRDVRRAVRAVGRALGPRHGARWTARTWRTFRRFHAVGLVPKLQFRGTRFVFHEAIAELCVDRLSTLPGFRVPLNAVGYWRMEGGADALDRWLVAVEIGAQETLSAVVFDGAMSHGAYNRMTRCLSRARDRYDLDQLTRLQLAILLNRTGNFEDSRSELTDELLDGLSSADDLTAMLATSRLEVTHEVAAEAGLEVLCRHSDPFVTLVGEYWRLHMDAHRGRFDSSRLFELSVEAFSLIAGREQSYWRTYSLARMHFDSLRHLYLEGAATDALDCTERGVIGDYLKDRFVTFEALNILYTRAHVVGHTVLPNLAIYHLKATTGEQRAGNVSADRADSMEELVRAAQTLYRRASDEFWQYGDRETVYLKADLANAAMMQTDAPLDQIAADLSDYKQRLDTTRFPAVASFPHFYLLRWNMLSYYRAMPSAEPALSTGARHHLDKAEQHLGRMVELDTVAENAYGLLRSRLLASLLAMARGRLLADCGLPELRQEMAANRYAREVRLLDHLIEVGEIDHVKLLTLFRFYPFVNQ